MTAPVRLNIGCGGRPLLEYINVDMDDLAALRKRYPAQSFSDDIRLENYDIFALPYADSSVDEIRADGLLEPADAFGEGRLGAADDLRRDAEIFSPGNHVEVFEIANFQR